VRQLNALKGAVGNPVELVLIGLSVVTFFDFSLTALFCAGRMLGTIAAFAHANVRFNPPRWYSAVFTTIEAHSLHHSVEYDETRCNYSCALILFDRLHGTFRAGEAVEVGQEGRRHMSIKEDAALSVHAGGGLGQVAIDPSQPSPLKGEGQDRTSPCLFVRPPRERPNIVR